MLGTHRQNTANRRLAQHFEHERLWLFTFLHCPGLDATNNAAERAIHGMVIARKVWGGNRSWKAHAPTDPGQRAAHLLAEEQGRFYALREAAACAARRDPGDCTWRGLTRQLAAYRANRRTRPHGPGT